MLFCYPIDAANENWLHEALVKIIQHLHAGLDAGKKMVKSKRAWLGLVPGDLPEAQKKAISAATGIRDRVFKYKNAISMLSAADRQVVLSALVSQNQISELLGDGFVIETLEVRYPDVHDAALDLFVFCCEKLTEFKVRERQYQIIFDQLNTKICPFCGIERLMNPAETAQDQDHYLAKSIYPFAAVNMRNLVPMCRCCNRDYKKNIDVIRDVNHIRRLAFDPYNCVPPKVSLLQSTVDSSRSPPLPSWQVDFMPPTPQAETWDCVFQIRTRYKRDILNEYFDSWFRAFVEKCSRDRRRNFINGNLSRDEIRLYLAYYVEDKSLSPSVGMAGFLEPLVFEFLLRQYDEGNERIILLIRDAVLGVQADVEA